MIFAAILIKNASNCRTASPRLIKRLESRISNDSSQIFWWEFDPSLAQNSIVLTKPAPTTYMDSSSIKKSRFWQKLSLQFHHYVPKMHQKLSQIWSTSIDLHPSLHKPFKIKELGLLTHIAGKSASRRFSCCNSQLLIPKISQEKGQFTFLLADRLWARVVWDPRL